MRADGAGATRADKALGHSTFGFARGSADDVRLWEQTADEEAAARAALGPLGDARERLRALREGAITLALRGALAG